MRVLVAGWVGSTNLGDELVFAGLRRLLAEVAAERGEDVEVAVISRDPAATRREHGVGAVSHADLAGVVRAVGQADAVLFGGGGLLQDTTSPFNLPYHLSRVVLARLRGTPFAGIGLGAGALDTRLGRAQVTRALAPAVGVTVRDEESRALLDELGVADVRLASDLAFALADGPEAGGRDGPLGASPAGDAGGATGPDEGGGEHLAVCLRPWSGQRGRLPAAARGDATPEPHVAALAAGLDRIADEHALAVRFVAVQRDRDEAFHRRVAERMRTPVDHVAPGLDELVGEVAGAAAVVSMRFHGGVAAVLGGRPVVLIDYAAKVGSLAGELGAGGALLPWDAGALAELPAAFARVVDHGEEVLAARERLVARQSENRALLHRLLEVARG